MLRCRVKPVTENSPVSSLTAEKQTAESLTAGLSLKKISLSTAREEKGDRLIGIYDVLRVFQIGGQHVLHLLPAPSHGLMPEAPVVIVLLGNLPGVQQRLLHGFLLLELLEIFPELSLHVPRGDGIFLGDALFQIFQHCVGHLMGFVSHYSASLSS